MLSGLERVLSFQLKTVGIAHESEYRFAAMHVGLGKGIKDRLKQAGLKDYRADFAFTNAKLLVEVEGGGWTSGRHTRGKGFADDLRKYQAAMRLGWTVYRCDGDMVNRGEALKFIEWFIAEHDWRINTKKNTAWSYQPAAQVQTDRG